MDFCFLCLQNVKKSDDCILMHSDKWKEQNIKNLIDIHLWPMDQNPASWICIVCVGVLHDFHIFYNRIRSAQQNYDDAFKNTDDTADIENFPGSVGIQNVDNSIRRSISDCHLEQHITLEQPLPTEFVIDGPFIKTEDNLSKDGQENNTIAKRVSPRQDILLKDIDNLEDPLMKMRKINRKGKSKKKFAVTPEDNMMTENYHNFESERINSPDKYNNSETDPEQHEDGVTSTRTIKKKNHRNLDEKTLKKYDKIIAEHFKIFCNICQLEMDNFLSLRRHFKTEHKQRGYARCCKRNFFTRSLLVDHIHVHLNSDHFKCHQCNKVFSDRSRLLCHKKLHEDDSKLDKCDICGKLFADKGALKKHVLTHSSQKLFPCTICGKFFTNSFILNHHIEAVHQNKFVQICDICGKSIRCPTAFASHMEKHEVKTTSISCDVCGLLLTNKEGLKRHKNSQHPEGGKKEHTCHICSKVSPTQRALKSHIRSVHEQGFDFKCSLCEKSFKRPAVLKEHMATHTGTALYTCLWCPRTFISNGNMYNHRKNAHPKEWEELKRQKYAGSVS